MTEDGEGAPDLGAVKGGVPPLSWGDSEPMGRAPEDKVRAKDVSLDIFKEELEKITNASLGRVNLDPDKVHQGLARLVLSLIELIRKLLERQALRRIEAGSLNPEEIERMGLTFLRLEEKMEELKAHFGLTDEDLNLNLGPLGNLM